MNSLEYAKAPDFFTMANATNSLHYKMDIWIRTFEQKRLFVYGANKEMTAQI